MDRKTDPEPSRGSGTPLSASTGPRTIGAAASGSSGPTSGSSTGSPQTSSGDSPFGANLEPVLRQVCDGRLGTLSWFRTDWQRGGALTGYSTYRDGDGHGQPVVVKLPVPPAERTWLRRLQEWPDLVPRIYADGLELGGYDMAWVVMERLPHGPLGAAWSGKEFDLLIDAVGRFHAVAQQFPLTGEPMRKDWNAIFHSARKNVLEDHDVAHEQRWGNALKKVHRKLKDWAHVWESRRIDGWCHGDLHMANAMTRVPAPQGPAMLFDFASTRPGHWIEDAVYFEHLFWARRQRLDGRKICKLMAQDRKARGLPVGDDWPRLASIKRVLLAMTTPAVLDLDGEPHFVEACLEMIENEVGR